MPLSAEITPHSSDRRERLVLDRPRHSVESGTAVPHQCWSPDACRSKEAAASAQPQLKVFLLRRPLRCDVVPVGVSAQRVGPGAAHVALTLAKPIADRCHPAKPARATPMRPIRLTFVA